MNITNLFTAIQYLLDIIVSSVANIPENQAVNYVTGLGKAHRSRRKFAPIRQNKWHH